MAWLKDTTSQSPKTVYTAPAEAYPMTRVIYDPDAEDKWCVTYAHLQGAGDTQESIEAVIGL